MECFGLLLKPFEFWYIHLANNVRTDDITIIIQHISTDMRDCDS